MQTEVKTPQENQTIKIQETIGELLKMKAVSHGNIPDRFQQAQVQRQYFT